MKVIASLRSLSNWFFVNKLSLSIDIIQYFWKRIRIKHNCTIQLCDSDIKQVNCSKYPGVYVDSNLDWKDQIDYIYKKLIKFISVFYKLRCKLNSEVLKMLYFSFIYPHLLHGVEVYANTSESSLKQLMVLNNKILHVLQMQPRDVRTVQLYKKYNTLPIPELHNYQIHLLVHKLLYHSNKLPAAFDGYFVPNSALHCYSTRCHSDLHLLSPQTAVGKKNNKV